MQTIREKLQEKTSGEVFEIAMSLKGKLDDASDMVFTAALEVLEGMLSEEKFLEVVEALA